MSTAIDVRSLAAQGRDRFLIEGPRGSMDLTVLGASDGSAARRRAEALAEKLRSGAVHGRSMPWEPHMFPPHRMSRLE